VLAWLDEQRHDSCPVPILVQYVTEFRFTHSDLVAAGDRTTTNQSHRSNARPISSCHCWAPFKCVLLYQYRIP
jgi:hypothetical protein